MSTQVLHLKQYSDRHKAYHQCQEIGHMIYEVLSTNCTVIIANNVIVAFRVTCENAIKACVCNVPGWRSQ
jgi:hypothetical protein